MTLTLEALWPKTVGQQLMAILSIVLIIAQIINLAFLLGAQQLTLRATVYDIALKKTAEYLQDLPADFGARLPMRMPPDADLAGEFSFTRKSRATIPSATVKLPKLALELADALDAQNTPYLQIIAALSPNGPLQLPPQRQNFGEPRNNDQGPPSGRFRGPDGDGAIGGPMGSPRGGLRPPAPLNPNAGRGIELQELVISVELKEGVWFNAMVPHRPIQALTGRILLATGVLMALILIVTWIFVRRVVKPYAQFADAANRLGRGDSSAVLSEKGPLDVRQAAIAFNQMQNRLSRLIESQRTMLRAVGHDLRTPLTAMRLSVEDIDDEAKRLGLIESIDDMTVITGEILGWAKDLSGTESMASVNLTSMLESLCHDYADAGADVTFETRGPVIASIRRVAMKRAIQNLVDNALKYAGNAAVSIQCDQAAAYILIDDDGPGIPQNKLSEVLKPFVRVEASRNKATGGTGLGLAIASSIIQTDGGKLILSNRTPHGLRAQVQIPF